MKKLLMGGFIMGMCFGAYATSFSYQGVLKDAQGQSLSAGTKNIAFRLYTEASGGTALWGRQFPVLLDSDGLFTLELSDSSGSSIEGLDAKTLDDVINTSGHGDLYIGLTVEDSSGEITPRQKLLPVPVASFAQNVDTATGDFAVTGKATFNGAMEAKGDVTLSGTTKITALTVSGGATLGGDIKTTGALTAQGGLAIPSGTTLTYGGRDLIPSGTIWMWYGDANNLPEGWVLCDGSNGTPDMRDRFPVGAGSSYGKGATGGENTHKLTVDEMPSHSHSYSFHGADLKASWDSDNYFYDASDHYPDNNQTRNTNSTGGDQAHENRPPYLALYFIMKK